MIVYFDTNIYRDLAEKRIPDADKKLAILKAKVEARELIICPSFEVIAEITFGYTHNKEEYLDLYTLFCDLVNTDYIIRPSNDILVNEVVCFTTLKITNHFIQPDEEMRWVANCISNSAELLPGKALEKVYRDSIDQSERFTKTILTPFSEEAIEKLRDKPKQQIENEIKDVWKPEGTAGHIAMSLVDFSGLKDTCKKKGIDRLLKIPSMQMAVGYIISTWIRQIELGAIAKKSSAYDFRHVVCSSVTGNIVTEDRKFKNTLLNIPDSSVRVFSLEELLEHLDNNVV